MCNVTCCHSIPAMMGCSAINYKPDEPFRPNAATCWVFAHNNLKSNLGSKLHRMGFEINREIAAVLRVP